MFLFYTNNVTWVNGFIDIQFGGVTDKYPTCKHALFLTGVTILLSLMVFLLLVAETMPPTSDAVPLIGMYCDLLHIVKIQKCKTKVWRYKRGNQKTQIEGKIMHWPKMKKDKRTNNDLQNISQKAKDRAT